MQSRGSTKKALSRKRLSHDGEESQRRIQGPRGPFARFCSRWKTVLNAKEREREYYKRTADADRNTLLKSGQRRGVGGSGEGGWETGMRGRDGDETRRDETKRDETVDTSSPRHVNRSERPRSTHGENRGRIPFVSFSLSLPFPFFFFSPVRLQCGWD